MRFSEVANMNVVANCRTIRRWMIHAKHRHLRSASKRGIKYERDKVGFRVVVFTDLSGRRSTGGVEIPQTGRPYRVGALEVIHHPLTDELGEAIWIYRFSLSAFTDQRAV